MKDRKRKYRGYPLQLKYAMTLTLMAGFTMLVMIFVMAWFIQRNYNLFMGDELGVSSQVIRIVQHEQNLLEMSLFLLFLISICLMFGTALFVTRKLTGPVVAVQRHLWLMVEGDWNREFKLRKNDEFKDLEYLVNQVRKRIAQSDESRSAT